MIKADNDNQRFGAEHPEIGIKDILSSNYKRSLIALSQRLGINPLDARTLHTPGPLQRMVMPMDIT